MLNPSNTSLQKVAVGLPKTLGASPKAGTNPLPAAPATPAGPLPSGPGAVFRGTYGDAGNLQEWNRRRTEIGLPAMPQQGQPTPGVTRPAPIAIPPRRPTTPPAPPAPAGKMPYAPTSAPSPAASAATSPVEQMALTEQSNLWEAANQMKTGSTGALLSEMLGDRIYASLSNADQDRLLDRITKPTLHTFDNVKTAAVRTTSPFCAGVLMAADKAGLDKEATAALITKTASMNKIFHTEWMSVFEKSADYQLFSNTPGPRSIEDLTRPLGSDPGSQAGMPHPFDPGPIYNEAARQHSANQYLQAHGNLNHLNQGPPLATDPEGGPNFVGPQNPNRVFGNYRPISGSMPMLPPGTISRMIPPAPTYGPGVNSGEEPAFGTGGTTSTPPAAAKPAVPAPAPGEAGAAKNNPPPPDMGVNKPQGPTPPVAVSKPESSSANPGMMGTLSNFWNGLTDQQKWMLGLGVGGMALGGMGGGMIPGIGGALLAGSGLTGHMPWQGQYWSNLINPSSWVRGGAPTTPAGVSKNLDGTQNAPAAAADTTPRLPPTQLAQLQQQLQANMPAWEAELSNPALTPARRTELLGQIQRMFGGVKNNDDIKALAMNLTPQQWRLLESTANSEAGWLGQIAGRGGPEIQQLYQRVHGLNARIPQQ